jgi:hypothetical protein
VPVTGGRAPVDVEVAIGVVGVGSVVGVVAVTVAVAGRVVCVGPGPGPGPSSRRRFHATIPAIAPKATNAPKIAAIRPSDNPLRAPIRVAGGAVWGYIGMMGDGGGAPGA